MNSVTNGAWPLVVMRVLIWYWMVWIPSLISFFVRFQAISSAFSMSGSMP